MHFFKVPYHPIPIFFLSYALIDHLIIIATLNLTYQSLIINLSESQLGADDCRGDMIVSRRAQASSHNTNHTTSSHHPPTIHDDKTNAHPSKTSSSSSPLVISSVNGQRPSPSIPLPTIASIIHRHHHQQQQKQEQKHQILCASEEKGLGVLSSGDAARVV